MNCDCNGSGYVSAEQGGTWDYKPCPRGCKQYADEAINYPLKHWDGDTETGGD